MPESDICMTARYIAVNALCVLFGSASVEGHDALYKQLKEMCDAA